MAAVLMGVAAVHPSADELWQARRWVRVKLLGESDPEPPTARIEVVRNHDPVQKNARVGRALNIAGRRYWRGLFCHAPSELRVRLPGPGRRFRALVGVDSNEQTRGGRGSVVFRVLAGGRELFSSPLMRERQGPVEVDVGLGGTNELALIVEDAGDGIACDQADWAEARVMLENGSVVWLGDMAIVDPQVPAPKPELVANFNYGGRPFRELAAGWRREVSSRKLDKARTEHTLTWTDPTTKLQVRCVAAEYADFPVVEWTVYLTNGGEADTPIISDLVALDATWQRYQWREADLAEFKLHHFTGSICARNDYQPHVTPLKQGADLKLAPVGGRPTNGTLCFFNLEWPSEGVIVAIGWPGQWAAEFKRQGPTGLRLRVGQELTHFKLHPGEQVRTPLVALLFWRGDWPRAQNLWRAWMLAYNVPRPGGKLPPPQWNASSSPYFNEMIHADEASQKLFISRYLEHGLDIGYWWMDAGWYPCDAWYEVGTWEPDPRRFPHGLRAVTDFAHERGVKCIVWFEPERVRPGTWLYEKHPEWLLGPQGGNRLLNLGNPQALDWLIEHIDGLINSEGIDLYRQDFNMDPLEYWRSSDAPDRQGITEIRYVCGLLEFWDELRRRHPNLLIDTCASGGRRNDLETLRRAVPLHRSDYVFEPVGQQCHTYGIAMWIPFFGAPTASTEPYEVRSTAGPVLTTVWDVRRDDFDYEHLRRLAEQWRRVAPYFYGDYYPLTAHSTDETQWMAWQFHRPDRGDGMVQVFRRAESIYEAARLLLRGLDLGVRYEIEDIDGGGFVTMTGEELMQTGLPVTLPHRPQASVFFYTKRRDE